MKKNNIDIDDVFDDYEIQNFAESHLNMIKESDVEIPDIDEGDEVYPCIEVKTGEINNILNGYIEHEIEDLYIKLGPNVLLESLHQLNRK